MRSRGFTLLEVVLAIGLSGAVLGLLATAIDSYLVRVDASRTQVESAQLARALLNQISRDLRSARYSSPSSNSETSNETDASAGGASVQGIFGTERELRIDRASVWQWESLARQMELSGAENASNSELAPSAMPQTVRYLIGEGKELLAAKLAATGVSEEGITAGYAGLYREQVATAIWMEANAEGVDTLATGNTEDATLIAPEVVEIAFAYFDGTDLLPEWDSSLAEGLPTAVEIRLTMLEEPFEEATKRQANERDELRRSKENLVEYRLVVALPDVGEPQAANFPQAASQGAQQSAGVPDGGTDSEGSQGGESR